MKQVELARSVGVSGATVSDWEHGKQKPRGANLIKLAQVLGVGPRWLSTGLGKPNAPYTGLPDGITPEQMQGLSEAQIELIKAIIEANGRDDLFLLYAEIIRKSA